MVTGSVVTQCQKLVNYCLYGITSQPAKSQKQKQQVDKEKKIMLHTHDAIVVSKEWKKQLVG